MIHTFNSLIRVDGSLQEKFFQFLIMWRKSIEITRPNCFTTAMYEFNLFGIIYAYFQPYRPEFDLSNSTASSEFMIYHYSIQKVPE